MIVGRGGAVLTGDDIYNTGVGQQRSMIVDDRLAFTIRIQNDGTQREDYAIIGTVLRGLASAEGFRIRYRIGNKSGRVQSPRFDVRVQDLAPQASRNLEVVVRSLDDTPLGAAFELHVGARPPRHGVPESDAVLIKITNVSTPEVIRP